jgi:hypothetical protein
MKIIYEFLAITGFLVVIFVWGSVLQLCIGN